MAEKLTAAERAEHLPALEGTGWSKTSDRDAIHKRFEFKNFIDAFGFMTRAAIVAEKMNHHPEWSNVYRNVDVVLTTHDADGVTELDVQLAKAMDALAG